MACLARSGASSLALVALLASTGCGGDGGAAAATATESTSPASSASSATSSASSASGGGTASASTSSVGGGGRGGGGVGGAGSGGAPPPPAFSTPLQLSDPAANVFVPSIAARSGQCLVVWQEFVGAVAHVAYAIVDGGVPQPTQIVVDPLNDGKHPWVATTTAGYVVAYQANDGTTDTVRAIEIDPTGAIVDGPVTISTPGEEASTPRVAAAGAEEIFAWTTGSTHVFAMRGPLETVPPTDVGTTLLSTVLTNFPRVALTPAGDAFLAYRDGGSDSADWDVLLVARPHGGVFGAPVDVSQSPGLLSDDISLALEPDGTLDLAWVDQDSVNVDSFEVDYATRSPAGAVTAPARYGTQGLWTWTPSVAPGLGAVWYAGTGVTGPLYYGSPDIPPTVILPGSQGRDTVLALGPDGVEHLAFSSDGAPAQLVYSEAPAP